MEYREGMEQTSQEHKEEQELEKFEYEYKDAEGNVICVAKFELGPNKVEIIHEKTENLRQLHSLTLETPETKEKQVKLDVLPIINPHNLTILVGGDCDTATYLIDRKTIVTPQPQTQVDFAILLHELGHGDQNTDATMTPIIRLDSTPSSVASMQFEKLIERLNQISETIPRIQKKMEKIPIAELEELITLYKKYEDEENRHENLWSQLYEESKLVEIEIKTEQSKDDKDDNDYENLGNLMCKSETIEQQMDLESKKVTENYKERKKIEQMINSFIKKYKITAILHVPTMLKEADATQRATKLMQHIRDSRINIVVPQQLSGKYLELFLQHQRRKDEVAIEDPTQILNRNLTTYQLNHRKWVEKRKKSK